MIFKITIRSKKISFSLISLFIFSLKNKKCHDDEVKRLNKNIFLEIFSNLIETIHNVKSLQKSSQYCLFFFILNKINYVCCGFFLVFYCLFVQILNSSKIIWFLEKQKQIHTFEFISNGLESNWFWFISLKIKQRISHDNTKKLIWKNQILEFTNCSISIIYFGIQFAWIFF